MFKAKTQRKKLLVVIIILIVLAALFTAVPFSRKGNMPSDAPYKDGDNITVEGEYVCLPKQDTGDMQTLECALGLKTDDDLYYSLQFGGSSHINYQTGHQLKVVGTFRDTDQDPYISVGKIIVDEAEQLD